MTDLRLLNVSVSIDPVAGGGMAERTFQMSRQLAQAGVDCTILTLDIGITPERRRSLGAVRLVALPCWNRRFYLPQASWGAVKELVRGSDVIHLMGHWTVLNALVFMAARSLGRPYVVCPAGALPIFGRSQNLKRLYNWLGGRRLVESADRCIAITRDERVQLHGYGVGDERIVVIPNGIGPEEYASRDDAGFRMRHGLGSAPIILFVGRLNRIKGPDLLLRAFCAAAGSLGDFQLVFVGPDEGLRAELERAAAAQGLAGRVRFLGYLGGADKSQAYHAAALLAIPSRQEAMSIVVLEAGLVGRPVLLTDQCGMNEIAACGGARVVPASVEGLRAGLLALCAGPARLPAMGEALRGYVTGRFLWSSVVSDYLALFERVRRGKTS